VPPASNVEAVAAPPKDEPRPDGEPAPDDGASKPSDQPDEGDGKPAESEHQSRRQRAAEENRKRIADLEAEVASLKSATPADPDEERDRLIAEAAERARAEERERITREQTEAEQRREREALAASEQADIERFDRLNALPDDHPTLAEGDNWAWLQEKKRLLSQFPQADAHYRTAAQQAIERAREQDRADLDANQQRFWDSVRNDLATAKQVPGVDFDAVRAAKTFAERDQILYAAGASSRDAEVATRDETIARLEDEVRDLKLVGPRGLGSRRAPVEGGRSGTAESGPRSFDPDRSWRQNLGAALAGSNGQR